MTKICTANDTVGISSRYTTDEGFLVARGVLARTGTQVYLAGELGLDGDPTRRITLYRPPEEVFNHQSMASFDGKALTINHPPVLVDKSNWKEYSHGQVGNIERSGNDTIAGDITFQTDGAIKALEGGKRELSNGYTFKLDMTPGTAPCGTAYDGIQRNIRGNHIALVDKGRCGSACRVSDGANPQPQSITKEPKAMKKIVVDGIPMELEGTQAGIVEKLVSDREAAVAMAAEAETKLQAAKDEAKAAADKVAADHAAELDALRKDVVTPEVRDSLIPAWAAMVDTVKKHSAIDTAGKTCNAIRREFVESKAADAALAALVAPVLGGVSAADASDDSIKAAFGVMAAALDAQQPAGNGGEKAVGDKLAGNTKTAPVMDARTLFIHNQANRA